MHCQLSTSSTELFCCWPITGECHIQFLNGTLSSQTCCSEIVIQVPIKTEAFCTMIGETVLLKIWLTGSHHHFTMEAGFSPPLGFVLHKVALRQIFLKFFSLLSVSFYQCSIYHWHYVTLSNRQHCDIRHLKMTCMFACKKWNPSTGWFLEFLNTKIPL